MIGMDVRFEQPFHREAGFFYVINDLICRFGSSCTGLRIVIENGVYHCAELRFGVANDIGNRCRVFIKKSLNLHPSLLYLWPMRVYSSSARTATATSNVNMPNSCLSLAPFTRLLIETPSHMPKSVRPKNRPSNCQS